MHDIGKVGTPDGILLKPGRLTPDEWKIMKRHTIIGHDILASSSSPILRRLHRLRSLIMKNSMAQDILGACRAPIYLFMDASLRSPTYLMRLPANGRINQLGIWIGLQNTYVQE